MLKLFFHRNSLLVKGAFWIAGFLTAAFIYTGDFSSLTLAQKILFALLLIQVAFAKAVEIYPWYPKEALGPGIRLQFQKAIVPVAYLWLSALLFLWLKPLTLLLALFNLLLFPMGVVASILIHFHRMDPDPSEPNILSSAKPPSLSVPGSAKLGAALKEPVSP